MDADRLDKLVNARTIETIRIDVVENGFVVRVYLRTEIGNEMTFQFVFAQPRQASDFMLERLSKLPD